MLPQRVRFASHTAVKQCGACKCKVLRGETKALVEEQGLTDKEKADGWILSCARTAISETVLEVESLEYFDIPAPRVLPCRVSSLDRVAKDVIKVVLRLPSNSAFSFISGQYIDVIGRGGLRRSYSLANRPNEDNLLELHIRAVETGAMSQYWFNQSAVNDLLRMHGPHGTFFLRNSAKRDLIFLATGTGIAPVKAMLEQLPTFPADQQPRSITVLWGVRHAQDLYLDFSELPSIREYMPVLSRAEAGWRGERGYVQDALLHHLSDLSNAVVYACGSDAMTNSAKSTLIAAGLPSQQFHSEAFVCSSIVKT
jgi:CDP-4-dehydro-6-deoxyglucose reductase